MKSLVLAVVLLMGATVAGAQSLGDLARKEEARRKAIASSGRVYTNESLKTEPSPSPAPATSAPAAPGQPPARPSPSLAQGQKPEQKPEQKPAADETRSEPYWRQRVKEARDGLARSQTFAEALQSRINALSTDFVNRDDPAQRGQIEMDRHKAVAELERVRKEITQYQKSIEDIQEEARRGGIPPGWLR